MDFKICTNRVSTNYLKKGDIILTDISGNGKKVGKTIGSIIKTAISSEYSHALIYLGGTYAEANKRGVNFNNISRLFFENEKQVKVLRYKSLTLSEARKIELEIRSKVGTPYSYLGAVKTQINPNTSEKSNDSSKEFCSKLIAETYKNIGITLVPTKIPSKITPKDLEDSFLLEEIKVEFLEVSKEEEKAKNLLLVQEEVNQKLTKQLKSIFKKNQGVNNLSDSIEYLLRQINDLSELKVIKRLDKKIAIALKRSGYLYMWKNIRETDYSFYSKEKTKALYDGLEKKLKFQRYQSEYRDIIENIERFKKELNTYIQIEKDIKSNYDTKFQTITLSKELYLNLINELSLKRIYVIVNSYYNIELEFQKIRKIEDLDNTLQKLYQYL